MSEDEAYFDILMPFDSDDPEFARGFGLGQIWATAMNGSPCSVLVPVNSSEMLARFREFFVNAEIVVHIEGDDWLRVAVNLGNLPCGHKLGTE